MRILATAVCLFFSAPALAQQPDLTIFHIRVGQGDATLILGPPVDGQRLSVLIDAGNIPPCGYDGGEIVRAVLWKQGVERLDYFVATHYDADHIGGIVTGEEHLHGESFVLGLNQVPGVEGDDDGDGRGDWLDSALTKMRPDPEELGLGDDMLIANFIDRGDTSPPTSQTYQKYLNFATAMGVRTSLEDQDDVDTFQIDLGNGAVMTCLAANGFVRDRDGRVPNVNTENERSLCFLLTYGGFHYLTGGDAIGRAFGSENAAVEGALGQYIRGRGIHVDVLHVNHHGANNASDLDFLLDVSPEIAVISLGNDNNHHHPHNETLQRLVAAGVYRIYQTSWGTTEGEIPLDVRRHQAIYQNDVIITTDGGSYTVSTARRFPVDE